MSLCGRSKRFPGEMRIYKSSDPSSRPFHDHVFTDTTQQCLESAYQSRCIVAGGKAVYTNSKAQELAMPYPSQMLPHRTECISHLNVEVVTPQIPRLLGVAVSGFSFPLKGQKVHHDIPVEWTQVLDCTRKDLLPVGKLGSIYHVSVGTTARPEWITIQRRELDGKPMLIARAAQGTRLAPNAPRAS
jgi:hypothetical protein